MNKIFEFIEWLYDLIDTNQDVRRYLTALCVSFLVLILFLLVSAIKTDATDVKILQDIAASGDIASTSGATFDGTVNAGRFAGDGGGITNLNNPTINSATFDGHLSIDIAGSLQKHSGVEFAIADSNGAAIQLKDTDAGSDEKSSQIIEVGGQLLIRGLTDNPSGGSGNLLLIDKTGVNANYTRLFGSVLINGADDLGTVTITEGDSGLASASALSDTMILQNNGNVGLTLSTDGVAGNDAYILNASGTDPSVSYSRYDPDAFRWEWAMEETSGGSLVSHFFVDGDDSNPAGTFSGTGNFISDGYDNHPSRALVDGIPHKENIRLGTNDGIVSIRDLGKMDKPTIFRFDETPQKYYKTIGDFQDETRIDYETAKRVVIKSATQQMNEYNNRVDKKHRNGDYLGKVGFIVETLPDRFLSRDRDGNVQSIKQSKAVLELIADLQREVEILKARVAALEAR